MSFKRKAAPFLLAIMFGMIILLFTQCIATEKVIKQNEKGTGADNFKIESENVLGFGILHRIPGLWNEPDGWQNWGVERLYRTQFRILISPSR